MTDPASRKEPFLRAFRDRYVAFFGGLSYDLAPGVAGVAPQVADAVPDLMGREVLVADGRRPHPGASFTVISLDRLMRNAREVAAGDRIVFSSFDLDDPGAAALLERLRLGDPLYLNTTFDRLKDPTIRRPSFGA